MTRRERTETNRSAGENSRFIFSVVMAVYNVGQYLEDALNSLRRQTIGFENIQLILVDDGSTDGSAEICDRWARQYPGNVQVIHKPNGGVSSARNQGLAAAAGQFINFMDADDMMAEDAFQKVFYFFEKYGDETDAVSLPIRCFGDLEGEPWENNKFARGERVIRLQEDYQIRQAPVNSAFIRKETAQRHTFDENLIFGEDFKYMIQVMAEKETLGVVPDSCYHYRMRGNGTSATEKRRSEITWYTLIFDRLYDDVNHMFLQTGCIPPRWVQFGFLWDMKARIHDDDQALMDRLLTEEQQKEYVERIQGVLTNISDQVIQDAPDPIFDPFYKAWMLKLKNQNGMEDRAAAGKQETQATGSDTAEDLTGTLLEVFSVSARGKRVHISGIVRLYPQFAASPLEAVIRYGGEEMVCELDDCRYQAIRQYRELICAAKSFDQDVFLSENSDHDLAFFIRLRNAPESEVRIRHLEKGIFALSSPLSSEYGKTGDWKYILTPEYIRFIPLRNWKDRLRRELRWEKVLLGQKAFKALSWRIAAQALKTVRKKPVWLISDRIEKADDNGEAFFAYMAEKHAKEITSRFVISKASPDYRRLKKTCRVIPKGGFLHAVYSLISEVYVSSSDRYIINDLAENEKWNADLTTDIPFVFLQHGIIKDDLSKWLNKWYENFDGFVTSVRPEYEAILREDYGYTEKEIWLTGLPRFDRLSDGAEKIITIMPTWRAGLLAKEQDPQSGQKNLLPDFENTDYCRFFHELLNHPALLEEAEKQGYRIQFKLHPQMGAYAEKFRPHESVRIVPVEASYREIYAKSSLVVTDYSSAVFDFAYLRKPVVYAQFDRETVFHDGHIYQEGYFDYRRDGLGPVTETVEETAGEIIRYMKSGCKMEKQYRDRADRFFAFSDRDNSQRVYEKIQEMLRERKGQ